MTKTKIEEIMESVNKADEVKGNITQLILLTKKGLQEDLANVDPNGELSEKGREAKKATIRKEYEERFVKAMRQFRTEYDESLVKAATRSEILLNEKPERPMGANEETFERKFKSLQMELMLDTNPDTAVRKLNDFVSEQKHAYFNRKVLDEFPNLVSSVLGSASGQADKYKIQLQDTLRTLQSNSMTDEQQKAQQIYDTYYPKYGEPLYLSMAGDIHYDSINNMFGRQVAQRAGDRPQYITLDSEKTSEE